MNIFNKNKKDETPKKNKTVCVVLNSRAVIHEDAVVGLNVLDNEVVVEKKCPKHGHKIEEHIPMTSIERIIYEFK